MATDPLKKVNGNRMKFPCSDIFAHGFDIVIQAPPFMDQNNHWRTLFISFGKIGADRAAVWGWLIDWNVLYGLRLGKFDFGRNSGKR